jgi:hypothetical protein
MLVSDLQKYNFFNNSPTEKFLLFHFLCVKNTCSGRWMGKAKYGIAIFGVGLFYGVSEANTIKQTWQTV